MVIKAERKKLNNEEIGKIIVLFKEKLKQEGVPFKHLIIFGSYVNDNAHIDSDIDVAVIIPSNISLNIRKKLNQISWWAKQVHIKLEPHILSTNDFRNRWLSLPAEIKKCGVSV